MQVLILHLVEGIMTPIFIWYVDVFKLFHEVIVMIYDIVFVVLAVDWQPMV